MLTIYFFTNIVVKISILHYALLGKYLPPIIIANVQTS